MIKKKSCSCFIYDCNNIASFLCYNLKQFYLSIQLINDYQNGVKIIQLGIILKKLKQVIILINQDDHQIDQRI